MSDARGTRGDAFEASEMHDGAPVVGRDKNVSRLMVALLAIPGLLTMALGAFIAVGNATASKPLPATALPFVCAAIVGLGALLCVLGVAFGVLRTVVTESAVHVRYGLWGPTIPIASIVSCKVVDYHWTDFGGWGIRRGKGGTWAYVPASSGPVLELVYREDGKERRVLVGASDAAGTAQQIDRARAQHRGEARVRVAGAEAAAAGEAEAADVSPASEQKPSRSGTAT